MNVLTLAAIEPRDAARVGGKAWSLARLHAAGLPVPDAVVLPVGTFAAVLRHADLMGLATEVSLTGDVEAAASLVAALRSAPWPAGLEEEVLSACRRLGGRVAVRSSAIDEDGKDRSFAGQYRSVLDVGPAGVRAAVIDVWCSLYEATGMAYRGRGPSPGGMGVVLQRQVRPRASGVLFTINPLSGSWREMVVEGVWGLGEPLVSGEITPHWFLVRRPRSAPSPVARVLSRVRLQLVQQDTPALLTRRVVQADGQPIDEPVPEAMQRRPVLDRSTLFRLCRLGLRVERQVGAPQDVEWAVDESGALVLLQARPITSDVDPRPREDVLWTRRFIGERWPEPATPLGWSIMAPIFEFFVAYPRTQQRYCGGGPAVRLYRSRPYFNVTVFRHLLFKLPGAPPPTFMLEFLPPEEERSWRRRFASRPDLAVYASILRETFAERRWTRFAWNPLTNPAKWSEFEERLGRELPRVSRQPVSRRDALALVDEQLALVKDYVGVHITSLLFANLFWQLLESALATWLPERSVALMEALAVSPAGNRTLEVNAALANLALQATDQDIVALKDGRQGHTLAFQDALGQLLTRYGHRSDSSWEVFAPRWAEQPERLVPLLEAYRRSDALSEPIEPHALKASFEVARTEALAALSHEPLRRQTLGWLIRMTREYLLLRENQRFQFDRLLFAMKKTLLWLGRGFTDEGVLREPNDIALLAIDEVRGLVEGSLDPSAVLELVVRREERRAVDAAEIPPVFLRGDEGVHEQPEGSRLQGLGISPGRARGRVRVLHRVDDGAALQPGEVLVAPAVDPAWTPLFGVAGAVVLEMGSRLSHGAVVAREYRVPAVVNISGVTRRLVDGQEVTVDGSRGVVWVHEGPPDTP